MKNQAIFSWFMTATRAILLSSIIALTASQVIFSNPTLAQTSEETEETPEAKKPTRSYVGLGGNIGLGGDSTALGDSGFALVGRTTLTDNLSLHTSTVFGDDNVSNFALTFGIPVYKSTNQDLELIYPFVGGGIAVEDIFGDFRVDGLVTTGVDVPILQRLVGTVRLNVGFAEDDTDLGLILGLGYNFSIFELF